MKNTQLVITQEKLPTERRLYEGEDYMFDVYPTKITIQDLKNSTTQTKILESCFQDLPVLLDGVYEYLDKNISIIVFRHQGVCFEGGYMNETAFFFPKPKSETSGPPLNIYTIQVVAGKAIKNLDSIKNKLIEFGQEPSIEKFVDKSNISWYRLRTGAYVYRSDAEEVAKKLKYLLFNLATTSVICCFKFLFSPKTITSIILGAVFNLLKALCIKTIILPFSISDQKF